MRKVIGYTLVTSPFWAIGAILAVIYPDMFWSIIALFGVAFFFAAAIIRGGMLLTGVK